MTYKNIKFEDSAVMRSLEKLALKKGLVKPENIEKTASSKPANNLKPTSNFEENIVKLCSALRKVGYVKQAEEVERNFLNYKKAVHLYDTHGEKGEDLVDWAHPEGSHQMKDVEGDALVETILDTHKAMEKMVSKAPSGKLARQNALNAVKIILSQQMNKEDSLSTQLNDVVKKTLALLNTINNFIEKEGNLWYLGSGKQYKLGYDIASNSLSNEITIDSLNKANHGIAMMEANAKPGMFGGADEDVWQRIGDKFAVLKQYIFEAKQIRTQINKIESEKIGRTTENHSVETNDVRSQFNKVTQEAIKNLNSYQTMIQSAKDLDDEHKKIGLSWVEEEMKELVSLVNQSLDLSSDMLKEKMGKAQEILNETLSFYNDWLK